MWDPAEQQWRVAFGEVLDMESIYGPFWIESEQSLYLGRPIRLPFGGLQSDGIRLQTAKLPELDSNAPTRLEDTPLWSNKRIDSGPEFPTRTRRVIAWEGSIVALTERGLFALDIEASKASDTKSSIPILNYLTGNNNVAYRKLTPEDWQPETPMDFCYVGRDQYFVVYSQGKLIRLDASEDGKTYQIGPSIDLGLAEGSLALVACNGQVCLIATNKGGLFRVDCKTWEKATHIEEVQECIPRSFVHSTHDDSFALLGRDGTLWRISSDGNEAKKVASKLQDCSAVMIDEKGNWWLAHDVNQVTCWDPSLSSSVVKIVPTWSVVEQIYNRLVRPLYWLNPKPAAVDAAIQRSLTKDDPLSLGRQTSELQIVRSAHDDLWQPIWSNTIFIVFMLAVGSWYLHRQDL